MWVVKRKKDDCFHSVNGFDPSPYVYHYEKYAKIELDNLLEKGHDVELFELSLVKYEKKKIYFKDVVVGQKFKYNKYPEYLYIKVSDNQTVCLKTPCEKFLHLLEKYFEVMDDVEVEIV